MCSFSWWIQNCIVRAHAAKTKASGGKSMVQVNCLSDNYVSPWHPRRHPHQNKPRPIHSHDTASKKIYSVRESNPPTLKGSHSEWKCAKMSTLAEIQNQWRRSNSSLGGTGQWSRLCSKRDSAGKISGVGAIGSVEGKQALIAMSNKWILEGSREGSRNFTYHGTSSGFMLLFPAQNDPEVT